VSDIRLLIVEDHMLLAEGIRRVLQENGVDVVGIATSGKQALDLAIQTKPNIVLMDIDLPDMDGIETGRRMADRLPGTRIVALTGLDDQVLIREAMLNGFHGYLHKHAPTSDLIESLVLGGTGQAVMPQKAAQNLASNVPRDEPSRMATAGRLTARERDVLGLLVNGSDTADIARRLFLSPNTVRTHVQNILSKLQVHSRLEAASYAVRHGLLPPPRRLRARHS
jgi:DNA-binding NarL/FixJ family response regulator